MKHAVILMVHKSPDHVEWLAHQLAALGAFVVLHVDRRERAAFDGLRLPREAGVPVAHLLEQPVVVNWSGFSQVRATALGINWIREHLPSVRYLHLMSGECLPLRRFAEIEPLMLDAGGAPVDLLDSSRKPWLDWRINRFCLFGEHSKNRTDLYNAIFRRVVALQSRLPARRNVPPADLRQGSQWWSLHRSSVEAMYASVDLRRFNAGFRWTRCADEHYFQILHHRAGLRTRGNLRDIEFQPGMASPNYLGLERLEAARRGGQAFARKVQPAVALRFAAKWLS